MRLQRIEINGFKSFADKTEIILEDGITGIVGPNGSGKSNIADAVRWVLGEQSSKNLRGDKMEDVIFGGTDRRRKKAYCEVALYFDNSDGTLPSEYSEIVIARKMYRSGESEYLLNQNNVRLRDILELIRDTGIGKEGYSIVGQGKIDEILSTKPLARRRILEEAAGVMKYRVRKEEAERKLERTEDNLTRIDDIIEELSTQLEPLKEQAEKTKAYQGLFERQKVLDAKMYVSNYERVQNRLKKLRLDLLQIESEIKQEQNDFEAGMKNIEALQERLTAAEEQVTTLQKMHGELLAEIEREAGQHNILKERTHTMERDVSYRQEEAALAKQKEAALREKIAAYEIEVEALQAAEQALEENVLLLQEKRDTQASALQDSAAQLEEKRRVHLNLLQEKAQVEQKYSALQEREARNIEDDKTLAAERESQAAMVAEYKQAVSLLTEQKETLQKEKQEAIRVINEETALFNETKEKEAELQKELNEKTAELRDTQAQIQFLQNLKQEYEGYSMGVKNLMRNVSKERALQKGVLGTFAELITVPQKYEEAIDAVLGGALQNVVVYTDEDAKAAVAYLRDKKLGRVSFMPLNALKIRHLSNAEINQLGNDVLRGEDAVTCDAAVRPAVEYLLGRTVIVKDMDAAVALAKKSGYAFRIVTLGGDVVNAGGIITGGSRQKRNFGLLSRERDIETAKAQEASLFTALETLQQTQEAQASKAASLEQALHAKRELLRQGEVTFAEVATKLQTQENQFSAAQNELTRMEDLYAQKKEAQEDTIKTLQEMQAALVVLTERIHTLETEIEAAGQTEENALGALEEEIAALRVSLATKKGERNTVLQTLSYHKNEAEDRQKEAEEKEREAANLLAQIAEMQAEILGKETGATALQKKEASVTNEIKAAEEARRLLSEEISEIQKKSNAFQLQQTALLESKYKMENQIERLGSSIETAGNKLWEDYGMTYVDAANIECELSYTQCVREIAEIREEIRQIGVVNPNAIEDYEKVYTRHTDLTTQKEDLEKAKDDLRQVIASIMRAMKEEFEKKFIEINKSFLEVFQTLFGGGQAELRLEDDTDIMECGIEIHVQPPGKNLQNLSLLSGGEQALVGIALLFALIKINPAPICLLDEIDASLDEANVLRLCAYLKTIDTSQFLVITHRKPTMEICDTLFGVAMEEKGVSKLVSVKMTA
ncbi:MAG: chromosome segregation protein SMC [Christensenellaceae bacterium]